MAAHRHRSRKRPTAGAFLAVDCADSDSHWLRSIVEQGRDLERSIGLCVDDPIRVGSQTTCRIFGGDWAERGQERPEAVQQACGTCFAKIGAMQQMALIEVDGYESAEFCPQRDGGTPTQGIRILKLDAMAASVATLAYEARTVVGTTSDLHGVLQMHFDRRCGSQCKRRTGFVKHRQYGTSTCRQIRFASIRQAKKAPKVL